MGMAGRNYQYATRETKRDEEWSLVVTEKLGYTRIEADRNEFHFEFITGFFSFSFSFLFFFFVN